MWAALGTALVTLIMALLKWGVDDAKSQYEKDKVATDAPLPPDRVQFLNRMRDDYKNRTGSK